MGSWLRRRGKEVAVCSAGPWDRAEIAGWSDSFLRDIPAFQNPTAPLTVILDCSSPDRTGYPPSALPSAPALVIDHHAAGSDFGDFRYVDPDSPSTTLMIQKIIEHSGDTPTGPEARDLFFGFCTDTGFFRHLVDRQGEAFAAVARLVDAGASPNETFQSITGGRTLGSRRILGRALDRSVPEFNGRIMVTWEDAEDTRELGPERDSDLLYQALLGIGGAEGAITIREGSDGFCDVGLRSTTDLDVGSIARQFGGGGHKKAAGCTVAGDRHAVRDKLIAAFQHRFRERDAAS